LPYCSIYATIIQWLTNLKFDKPLKISGQKGCGVIKSKIRICVENIAPNERKITAGEATKLLFFNGDETWWLNTTWRPESSIPNGNELHRLLGYEQDEIFPRYYYCKNIGQRIKVVGQPDKLNIDTGEALELKTYRYPCNKERQIIAGTFQAQCYCWLTGFEDWQVHIYNAVSRKMEVRIKGKLNLQEFRKMLDLAIDLQNLEFTKTNCLSPIEQYA
jgi:hypothetical protein